MRRPIYRHAAFVFRAVEFREIIGKNLETTRWHIEICMGKGVFFLSPEGIYFWKGCDNQKRISDLHIGGLQYSQVEQL